MPNNSDSEQGLSEALALAALGWNVVAAPVKGKSPVASWKRWQTERVPEREVRSMFARPANYFIVTGPISGLVVLDCDDQRAYEWWREQIGEILDQTTAVKTGRDGEGYHFYFKLNDGDNIRGRSSEGGETGKWDIRAAGQGVVAPPSVHATGRRYSWVSGRGPAAIQAIPPALSTAGMAETGGEGSARSLLAHLLSNVPAEGGRNNWLAQVAGHYAKHIPYQDAYEALVRQAADQLNPPLPEREIVKLVKSLWQSEQAKEGRAAPAIEEGGEDDWRASLLTASEDTGWLVSGGNRILVQVKIKQEDRFEIELATWMDCDIRVLGIVEGENDQVYNVELRFPDGTRVEDHLSARVVSDARPLNAWLASHGASIGAPDNLWPSKMRESTRLLRYLRAQGAESMEAAEALGWHEETGAFITHDGVIRATGPGRFERVRPDPAIRGWAPYRYGHSGKAQAQEILREVLTFHDETVASVFGAWWAAVFLKPQIVQQTSQFPFMALEASSESGKTTGFFSLMLQLAGSHAGQSNPTRAALRDALSAHNNGINWVDDLDDLDDIGELLRNVTVGGSMVKKGEGNHAQIVAKLRAALVISGESLGIQDQKALVDRAVVLDVPSPIDRKSVKGDYPQWDDIVALRTKYPDLTAYAGSIVELALAQAPLIETTKTMRLGSGRHADTLAIVRIGARILAGMLDGHDRLIDTVDAWTGVAHSGYTGKENVLTLKLLPRALRSTGWKGRPEGPDQRQVITPVFVERANSRDPGWRDQPGVVWFSPKLLAEWWEREPPVSKRVNQRVESSKALEQQARELGLGGSDRAARKLWRLSTGGVQRYWRCGQELSKLLLDRSNGLDDGEEIQDGTHEADQLLRD